LLGKVKRVEFVFDLDCNEIIPECGFRCDRCVSELVTTFKNIEGVFSFRTEEEGGVTKIIIDHDRDKVSLDQLMSVFSRLPSHHKAKFEPTLHSKRIR
jgi:hypothetical protein